MIPLAGLAVGFAFGWVRASKRGGKTADKWQYGIGHGVFLAIIAFFVSLVLLRFGLLPASPVD